MCGPPVLSSPGAVKVATTRAVVEVGRRAAVAGVNTRGTTVGSEGSERTLRSVTVVRSTSTGSGALMVRVTLSALLEPPWYTRYNWRGGGGGVGQGWGGVGWGEQGEAWWRL